MFQLFDERNPEVAGSVPEKVDWRMQKKGMVCATRMSLVRV